uniref:hypothetical protein n=1 Tax=Cellvibrio fontiphilus TaxID=1815559 RepID=UPI002B4BF269|nr:hypothetical protein [Cellvibrio fontiphilus]
MKKLMIKSVLLLSMVGLVACGGSNDKKSSSSSSKAASSTPASSSAASSSVAPVSKMMEAGKEYPYTAATKITNTGTTDLVVTKKYYWDSQQTVVVLQEGSATIE